MKSKSIFILIVVLTFICTNLYPQPPKYTVTFLGQESSALATALNNVGQIVGRYLSSSGNEASFLIYSNGTLIDLGTLGGPYSEAYDINLHGQVVGTSANSEGLEHAFLYSDGKMRDLGTLEGAKGNSIAYAINDLGQVVGISDTSAIAGSAGVVFWQGKITALKSLNEPYGLSVPYDINNHNHTGSPSFSDIVGYSSYPGNTYHAFLYSNDIIIDIGTKVSPHTYSQANAINDANQVVGYYCKDATCNPTLAFLYNSTSGDHTSINVAGGSSQAFDINNKGQAVGLYSATVGSSLDLPFLYMNGKAYNLFDLIPLNSGLTSVLSLFINDEGQIVANTNKGVALLTPVDEE